ncbi:MAG: helix-turn-helix domain-containing protein [Desulfatiglandales bacterium]
MEEKDRYEMFLEDLNEGFARPETHELLFEGIEVEKEEGEGPWERIHRIRTEKGLTLEDLSSRAGIDVKLLRDIEQGEVLPTLGDAIKIAKALDMKMGYLISGKESRPFTIVRADEGKEVSRHSTQKQKAYGYTYFSLAPHKRDRQMEPFIVNLLPTSIDEERSTHDGQEFIYVLEGELAVYLESELHILRPGDAIYYDSTTPHLVKCHGDRPTRILAVLYTGR